MDFQGTSLRDAAKLGFGFGLGFTAATILVSIPVFLLYTPFF